MDRPSSLQSNIAQSFNNVFHKDGDDSSQQSPGRSLFSMFGNKAAAAPVSPPAPVSPVKPSEPVPMDTPIQTSISSKQDNPPLVDVPPSPSLLKRFDVNDGTASSDATILFRYPLDVEPPPQEVCEFCLPLGGKLKRIL